MNVVPAVWVRVVRIVHTQRGIDDELDRAGQQLVPGIQHAAGLADVAQGRVQSRARLREWRQVREDAAEAVLAENELARPRLRKDAGHREARRSGHHGTRADPRDERPPTDPSRLTGGHRGLLSR